jgi:hypothetical protein
MKNNPTEEELDNWRDEVGRLARTGNTQSVPLTRLLRLIERAREANKLEANTRNCFLNYPRQARKRMRRRRA